MKTKRTLRCLSLIPALWALAWPAGAQFTITGVSDKSMYNNSVAFTVAPQAGYSYGVYLNTNSLPNPVPVGVSITVNKPDYYELYVFATNNANPNNVSSSRVRFIVNASERVGTETGLPPHTALPLIPSAAAELAGARLRLSVPQDFPAGYEIPVVAWVVNADGHARRVNGALAAEGHPSIGIKRGVGSGFLAATHPAGPLEYAPQLQGLATNKTINIVENTAWIDISGTLNGNVVWPENARIHLPANVTIPAGASLTIGPGAIVRIDYGIDIVNDGAVRINGTLERPVIFMPNSSNQPWGGFYMRNSSGSLEATGTVFTGSGQDPTGGAGHRKEQCLFLVDNSPRISLTDSAAIHLAGQLGHAYGGGTFTFTRFLLQRATTGGEYTGASFIVNDSAFIEFPDDTPGFADGDNDALYFVSGNYAFTNTLFGWTKDDGVDSGGSGYAPLRYQSCWFEATLHEGNSLSGYKDTRAWDTVYIDCGQGIEDGYNSPTGRVERCLFTGNKVGVRHGDNYTSIGSYSGNITAVDSIFLQNHHDVFGYNWRSEAWTNAVGQMFIHDNWFSVPDTNFPNNSLWNPAEDGWRLASFMTTPPDAAVGIGLALRSDRLTLSDLTNGVPVRLSIFTAHPVCVDYSVLGASGQIAGGTLEFAPGESVKALPAVWPGGNEPVIDVHLKDPVRGELTGLDQAWYFNQTQTGPQTLIAQGSRWNYLDTGGDAGTAWRELGYDDSTWSNSVAELGFGDNDEQTRIRRYGTNGAQTITYYFRQAFVVDDPRAFASLSMWLRRDDGGVVYLNGEEVFRSPNMPQPPTIIHYQTLTLGNTAENAIDTATLDAGLLQSGTNLVAVEIHQHDTGSSDASFDFRLTGTPVPRPPNIRRGPTNQSVLLGETAVFSVDATGSGPLGYQWWHNDNLLLVSTTGAVLTVTNVMAADAGDYRVVVVNHDGSATSQSATLIIPDADTDGDGMPDQWEQDHGLNANVNDADLDADFDGLTNLGEFLAGTDPQDPASYLKIETMTPPAADTGVVTLTFFALAGKSYSIESATDLAAGNWNVVTNIAAHFEDRLITVQETPAAADERFFRLLTPAAATPLNP